MAFSRDFLLTAEERQDAIQTLNQQRLEKKFCDVILIAGEQKIPAHKCVLSAASAYFRSMFEEGNFSESSCTEVELFSVDPRTLMLLLDMIYLGTLHLDTNNMYSTLEVADLILLESGKTFCIEFMSQVLESHEAIEEVVRIRRAACIYSISSLVKSSEDLIAEYFEDVAQTEAFLELSVEDVEQLIGNDRISSHEEYVIWEAVVGWVMHDEPDRLEYVDLLMDCIRFPLMDPTTLITKLLTHPLMKSDHCTALVQVT